MADFLRDHWLPALEVSGARRPSTLESYRETVEYRILPYMAGGGFLRLTALGPQHIADMITALRARGLAPTTIQYSYTILNTALSWGKRHGYLRSNPCELTERPKAEADTGNAWTMEEAQTFLASVKGDRLFAMWMLLVTCGLRRGEVAGLRWCDVDLDRATLRIEWTRVLTGGEVRWERPKTAKGRRTIDLDPGLVDALRKHRVRQAAEHLAAPWWQDIDAVFTSRTNYGAALKPDAISARFDRLVRRAGVPGIKLHGTRHTAASLMITRGQPLKVVSEVLGHASPTITMQVYQHVYDGQRRDAGADLSNALGITAD